MKMDRVMLVIKKRCFKKSVLNGHAGCNCWNYGRCTSPNAFCELKTEPTSYYEADVQKKYPMKEVGEEE